MTTTDNPMNDYYVNPAPISMGDLESRLVTLIDLMEVDTEEFSELCEDYAKKDAVYKKEWNQAFLQTDGPVKERETWASSTTEREYLSRNIADALLKSKKEKLSTLRSACDAIRTLSANVRSGTAAQ